MKNMLSEMIRLATDAHHGQFDKQGLPYIYHPLAVSQLLEWNEDEEFQQCVAVGHDLLEDTDVTEQDLLGLGFPYIEVVHPIVLLTKVPGQSYADYQQAVFSDVRAMIGKKADGLHNMDSSRRPPDWTTPKGQMRHKKYQKMNEELERRLTEALGPATRPVLN